MPRSTAVRTMQMPNCSPPREAEMPAPDPDRNDTSLYVYRHENLIHKITAGFCVLCRLTKYEPG